MSIAAHRTALSPRLPEPPNGDVNGSAEHTQPAADIAAELAGEFAALDLFARLAAVRARVAGRIVFTTSFGLEDQAVAHAILTQQLAIEIATLDTGRLFSETYEVWAATEERYGTRITAVTPDQASVEALLARQGVNGMRASVEARHECCAVRKVAPLQRLLAGRAAWITGLRASQSAERARVAAVAFEPQHRLLKVNPLFEWTRPQTVEFVRANDIPYNSLHDRGFLSIGCAPCTRAVKPGEPERAGRWWWEQAEKKECGLHITADGRVTRAASAGAQSTADDRVAV